MTTHERIIEDLMTNGWTKEESESIKGEFVRVRAIKVDKVTGGWEYTSSAFADKEVQALALDIVKHPTPKGE